MSAILATSSTGSRRVVAGGRSLTRSETAALWSPQLEPRRAARVSFAAVSIPEPAGWALPEVPTQDFEPAIVIARGHGQVSLRPLPAKLQLTRRGIAVLGLLFLALIVSGVIVAANQYLAITAN